MRIVVTSSGGAGHIGPLVPIVAALRRRGDEVVAVVPQAAAGAAQRAGAELVVAPDPPADELADAWARLRTAAPAVASRIANGEIFGRLDTLAALPAVRRVVADRRPDLVVHEAAHYAGVIAAVEEGVPYVQVAISFADAEAGSLRHAAVELDHIAPGTSHAITGSPYLTRFPAALDVSPYPVTRRYRAAVREPTARPTEGGPPLVYVTFGTVASAVDERGTLHRAALSALTGLHVRVLVTTGRGHRPDLGEVEAGVTVEEWVDQDVVLAEAALVVCHGGSGTVLGALAHGVPVVAVPLFADQSVNATRVLSAGAGLALTRPSTSAASATTLAATEVAALRAAVERVLGDPGFRSRAGEIGRAMRTAPDVLTHLDEFAGRAG
ncbi:glycosyltransferase [Jatrophihabitans sp. YIM 134969]